MLKIELAAGYYKCPKCGNVYVSTFRAIDLAPHMGRTRYMKCPKCGAREWNRKVLSRE